MVHHRLNGFIFACLIGSTSTCTSIKKEPSPVSSFDEEPLSSNDMNHSSEYETVIPANRPSSMLEVIAGRDFEQSMYDLLLITQAIDLEEQQKFSFATKYWVNALQYAHDDIGEFILTKLKQNLLANGSDQRNIAEEVLSEINKVPRGTFVDRLGYRSSRRLDYLLNPVTKKLKSQPDETVRSSTSFQISLQTDPLLQKLAKNVCQNGAENDWRSTEQRLPKKLSLLWQGHQQLCAQNTPLAAEKFKSFSKHQAKNLSQSGRVVFALSNSARIFGRSKDHQTASVLYKKLANSLMNHQVKARQMGMSQVKFDQFKANQILWASRYIALNNEYQKATSLAKHAQSFILRKMEDKASRRTTQAWAELYAEASHVLSFRIALEQRHYQKAIAYNQTAIEHSHVSKSWKSRLLWYQSIFAYLDEDMDQSKAKLDELEQQTRVDSYRTKLLFLNAMIAAKNNNISLVKYFSDELAQEFPTSYYNVVAGRSLAKKHGFVWKSDLPEFKNKKTEYEIEKSKFSTPPLVRLDTRAKVLIKAGYPEVARPIVQEIKVEISKNKSNFDYPSTTLYWNRLAHDSGIYTQPMRSTMILSNHDSSFFSRWPDQLLVSFPKPFAKDYLNASRRSGVDKNLLLAISRQESMFIADAESPAFAYGVMQLIEPTARKIAKKNKVSTKNLVDQLFEPQQNILLGSFYLSDLEKMFDQNTHQMVAAYNAGEHAVKKWLTHRVHKDPLIWTELIPYGETQKYTKIVMRNLYFYQNIYRAPNTSVAFDF